MVTRLFKIVSLIVLLLLILPTVISRTALAEVVRHDIESTPPPSEQATFKLSDLTISPRQATVGQPVTISVKVTSTGDTRGSYRISLSIDGISEASTEISLNPGESKTVSFNIVKSSPGTYHVVVGSLTGEFSLSLPMVYWIITIVVLIVALAGGMVLGSYRARITKQKPSEKLSKAQSVREIREPEPPKPKKPDVSREAIAKPIAPTTTIPTLDEAQQAPEPPELLPSTISIANLRIMPERVTQGSDIGIIANVTNVSHDTIQHRITLKINSQVKDSQEMTLATGQTKEVTFTTTADKPGEYLVAVGGLMGRFHVVSPQGEAPKTDATPILSEPTLASERPAERPSQPPTTKPLSPKSPRNPPFFKLTRLLFGSGKKSPPQPAASPRIPAARPKATLAPTPQPTIPSAVSISGLQILPDRVIPGSSIGIIVTVTNNIQSTLVHTLILKIDDEVADSDELTLSPLASRKVVFTATVTEPGQHRVSVDDVTGKFHVLPGASTEPTTTSEHRPKAEPRVAPSHAPAKSVSPFTPKEPPQTATKVPSTKWPRFRWPKFKVRTASVPEPRQKTLAPTPQIATASVEPPAPQPPPTPPPAPPSPVSLARLQILPAVVTKGSEVGIIATITNSSYGTVQHALQLKINGEVNAIQNIILTPQQSQEITFTITAGDPGEYQVALNGLTGRFRIVSPLGQS